MIARVVATCLALAAYVAPAHAGRTHESILMDDPKVVFAAPDELEANLAEMKALGADRIRVSVFWRLLAPHPESATRPFGEGAGADPRNYSAEKWDRYDRIVITAQKLGLKLLFNVTSPAPDWATGDPPRPDIKHTFRPRPSELADFVKALGTRYSGQFQDEGPSEGGERSGSGAPGPCDPVPTIPVPPEVCPPEGDDPGPDNPNPPNSGPVLPRVDTWSIWNEPNMPGWLTPQSITHPNNQDRFLPASPHVYRELADAMYRGLRETGHGNDTILLAETAPRGARKRSATQSIRPLEFIRELYCVNRRFRHFRGKAAAVRGCPDGGGGFAAAHPVLFDATGFAHHPYAFLAPPKRSDRVKDHAVLADFPRLARTLDRVFRRHGSRRRIPVWVTEYGYQTDPPDPYAGWAWKRHARFLAEAEWLAFRRARIRSMAQFLLYDDGPAAEYPPSDPRHWGTFQTGLRTADGARKLAYAGYQRTIHVVKRRRKRKVIVFGLYRPAAGRTAARIEFRRRGSRRWRTVKRLRTNRAGFMRRTVGARTGRFRIAFQDGEKRLRTRAPYVRFSR